MASERKFINPYNFVPVKKVKKEDSEIARKLHQDGSHHQDRFRKGCLSGRVVCEIETESPMFIGAGKIEEYSDENKTPAKLKHFKLNDRPAIPPSSLKGMLSSIMEAASNSALRVLERKTYTRRCEVRGEALSKIGILRYDTGQWFIEELPNNYIYLNRYRFDHGRKRFNAHDTLSNSTLKDYSVEPVFYYALRSAVRRPRRRYSHPYLDPSVEGHLITQSEYDNLSRSSKTKYVRGIIKHFGVVGSDRDGDIPPTKRHEIFVPYPNNRNRINIPQHVLEEFATLAKDAFGRDERMPFTPFGRHSSRSEPVRLRDGDLLYFSTETRGTTRVVDKISFAAIWRDFCGTPRTPSNAYDYFRVVDRNGLLLPPCLINQGGNKPEDLMLTPASALMGFVEEEKHPELPFGLSLAGRLFFSPGILAPGQNPDDVRLPERTLKELASPKPPCPEFYFHRKPGTGHSPFITKKELKPDGNFFPNGRKFYWHHHDENDPFAPDANYVNDRYKRIGKIRPMKKNVKFLFCIDFFNLTEFELGMLLYSLRPTNEFRHLIGMGKPIGMGKIRIDILNLLFVRRERRYKSDPLFGSDFFHYQTGTQVEKLNTLKNEFREVPNGNFYASRFCQFGVPENEKTLEDYRTVFLEHIRDTYGPNWLTPLENIGNPDSSRIENVPVQYPNLKIHGYDKSFEWWVRNPGKDKRYRGRGAKEVLERVPSEPGAQAPTLPENPVARRGNN